MFVERDRTLTALRGTNALEIGSGEMLEAVLPIERPPAVPVRVGVFEYLHIRIPARRDQRMGGLPRIAEAVLSWKTNGRGKPIQVR